MIEIRLNTPEQLLNSLDPSPFRTRDLDDKAADYIIENAEDQATPDPLLLVIDLPGDEAARDLAKELPSALQNSFRHRAGRARRQLREMFRNGRRSLAIGLGVLGLSILLVQLLELSMKGSALAKMIEQGLFILGWVAIWRPLEIFLYDWLPLSKRISILDRLAEAIIEVRAR